MPQQKSVLLDCISKWSTKIQQVLHSLRRNKVNLYYLQSNFQ